MSDQNKSAASGSVRGDVERRERLEYLADMLSELQTLSEREGCATLSGLLALAATEARVQADQSVAS